MKKIDNKEQSISKPVTASLLEDWTGIYMNSDDQKLTSFKEIKNKIGWYELIISPTEIIFSNDSRMESEFPTASPGGYAINYKCDYHISNDTIKLYEKKEDDAKSSIVSFLLFPITMT
ncbi:hypothetical protein LZQ00_10320 [Sphingobacterium sp. SRCM116780]|uniref:hypothetical protein n=1 Tax=Sphingobacterium sp. SRCM116780 TaxID=2907623 RepID=UPI001F1B385C|nr:hypothetical protein [Sphingobacterium sp. SRCM116780]UIR54670.1 hypothetical protein LZQ00_10320 [Sphingobacterium sp. SRCM116780]